MRHLTEGGVGVFAEDDYGNEWVLPKVAGVELSATNQMKYCICLDILSSESNYKNSM